MNLKGHRTVEEVRNVVIVVDIMHHSIITKDKAYLVTVILRGVLYVANTSLLSR